MKKTNKLLALVLAAVLCLGLSLPAMAVNSEGVTFEAQLDHATLNISDQDQTVTMTVSANKDVVVNGLQGTITKDSALTLTDITHDTLTFGSHQVNVSKGKFTWYDSAAQNNTVRTIVKATFIVPANTPAGTYTVGLKDLNCVKSIDGNPGYTWEDNGTASVTLTLVDPNHREPQTITAADVAMTYGDTNVKISATAIGQITYTVKAGSENIIDVAADGKLTAKNVGEAYVIVSAAGNTTYAPATKEVKVTVSPKAITPEVTVSAGALTYTGKDQTPAVIVKDGSQVLTEGVDYTLSYSNNRNAGQATVTITAKAGGRYTFTTVTENFTIGKAVITISADNKRAYVGEQAPVPTFTVKGLFGNDKLTVEPKAEYANTPDMSKAGTVIIKVSGAAAPAGDNYTIRYVNGLLTISSRATNGNGSGTVSSISVGKTENGTITVSPKTASKGDTVTITVKPADGYELDRLTATDADGDTIRLTEQRDGTYTFTMPAGKVEVNGTFVKKSAQTFVDVPENAYYAPAVAWAVEKGVTEGTSATTFSPDAACTRAQIVTFLYRAAGSPAVKSTVNPFTDVTASDYYYNAVLWAVENGITTGTSETTFSPNESCTRAQCVTFLYRAVGSAATAKASFTDVSADAYYAPAVDWAVEKGVTTGTSATTFSPDNACTRAQIVTFLYRAYQGK